MHYRQRGRDNNKGTGLLDFKGKKKLPLILQSEAAECGLACLAMIAGYHGRKQDLASLRRQYSLSMQGATLQQVMAIADVLGFAARPLQLDLESIAELRTPCIFHWDLNHFVVLKEATRKHIIIHDPARGERRLAYGDRWFAFPPLKGGTKWKTLDDVDVVIVAAVDDRDDPQRIEVYRFDAVEVRKRFDESYAARIQAGQTVKDNFGMWVNLDKDDRGLPASVDAGLAVVQSPVATYSIEELVGENGSETTVVSDGGGGQSEGETSRHEPHTIAEVMDWARKRIATLSGVRTEAVKLDCRIES